VSRLQASFQFIYSDGAIYGGHNHNSIDPRLGLLTIASVGNSYAVKQL
jgi:hypothetical protein